MSARNPQLAQIKAHPAVIVFGCLFVSILARQKWLLNLAPEIVVALRYIGVSLEVLGLAVLILSDRAMAKAKTTILPDEHSSTVVTLLLDGESEVTVSIPKPRDGALATSTGRSVVQPDFFRTMEIPLRLGRTFTDKDGKRHRVLPSSTNPLSESSYGTPTRLGRWCVSTRAPQESRKSRSWAW